jgi:hypothetical protein
MSDTKTTEHSEHFFDEQLRLLVGEANRGSPQAVLALRKHLQEHPEIWQKVGDLAQLAADHQLKLLCSSGDVLLRESLLLQLEAFKRQLVEPPGSPLEMILIERIAVCWIQANAADVILAQNPQANPTQSEFMQRRAERAQKNLLAAVKELCTVRKLLREAEARPLRQPRTSTKSAAEQAPPVADRSAACSASSQADAAAGIPSNSTPQDTPNTGITPLDPGGVNGGPKSQRLAEVCVGP